MDDMYQKLMWSNLFGLRLVFTIMPQYGFISNEEFESPRASAGILGLYENYNTSSEEDESLLLSALTSGIPFLILRAINEIGIFGNILTPYLVLVFPRIWMTSCSIVIDILIYKIAINCGYSTKRALSAMTLFASSYVTWIYFTRTMPVAFETIIFAGLIYAAQSATIVNEHKLSEKWNTIRDSVILSNLCALGTSINTGFMNYGPIPIIYWVLTPCLSFKTIILKFSVFIAALLPAFFFLSVLNTMFSNTYILLELLQDFDTTGLVTFVLQFHFYKPSLFINSRFTSINLIAINALQTIYFLTAMYGPCALILFPNIDQLHSIRRTFTKLMKREDVILYCAILINILTSVIFETTEKCHYSVAIVPITVLASQYVESNKLFFLIHCMFNLSGFIFYAMFRYGGAVHSMEFLSYLAKTVTHINEMEVVMYKTPVLPNYLTALPTTCETNMNGFCNDVNHSNINFSEVTFDTLLKSLDNFLLHKPDSMLILVIPGSISCRLVMQLRSLYNLQLFYKYFPHVIDFHDIPDYTNAHEWCDFNGGQHGTFSHLIEDKLTLNMYGVSRPAPKRQDLLEKANKLTILIDEYSSSI